jgi:thymidylate synthase
MVNAWNVGELDQMILPPCHYGFQVYTRELSLDERYKITQSNISTATLGKPTMYNHEYYNSKNIPTRAISLMWNQRSVDTFLGLPFNIASYGLLLEIIAKIVNMVPDELIGNLGDTHLYLNHIEQAKEQIGREPMNLPTLKLPKTDAFWNGFDVSLFGHLDPTDFNIENYQSHPSIKAPLSN